MIKNKNIEILILLISVMVVGLCTIIYELLIGSISSYFLGDSVMQFSLTIGLAMTAMGFGTYLSRLIKKNLIRNFIIVEIWLGLIGGLCVPILYAAFAFTDIYYPIMITLVFAIGILIGLEIPLLTRILEKHYPLQLNISNVLSVDYFGALIATLLFPFFLLPFFGIFNTSLITGLINLVIAGLNLWWFKDKLENKTTKKLSYKTASMAAVLLIGIIFSQKLIFGWESSIYADRIIISKQSKYQKVILTKYKNDLRLFLDGNLQFSSVDEHRYHEPLVHIPLNIAPHKEKVLVLGGGDGLVARELLKYPEIKEIVLVDLDPFITKLALNNELLKKLNNNSFNNPKVKIINTDAFKFLESNNDLFDVIIADLPDPNNTSIARIYSKEFYKLVNKKLSKTGIFVTQSTSPFFAPKAFWCINQTIQSSGFKNIYPYHVYIPSFGDWGFNLALNWKPDLNNINLSKETKYLSNEIVKTLFVFPKDSKVKDIKPSSLNNPIVLDYYLDGWKNWH